MEESQRIFLSSNLTRLVDNTKFDYRFLDTLWEYGIISDSERGALGAEAEARRSLIFYEKILPNKAPDSLNKTIAALRDCQLEAPANMLMEKDGPGPTLVLRLKGDGVEVLAEGLTEILRKVGDRKFVLYSINGAMRTGKSFLLSCILQYFDSNQDTHWIDKMKFNPQLFFKWRTGRDPQTKGIWVWPHPIFVTDKNGEQVAILFMDCQGEFDQGTSNDQNSKIFAMSTLLSSVSIYNILGEINEGHMQSLVLFLDVALKSIQLNRGRVDDGHAEGRDRVRRAFQTLMILHRDVSDEFTQGCYTNESVPEGQTRNLFVDLFSKEPMAPEVRQSRQQIQSIFEKICVYALAHPGMGIVKGKVTNVEQDFIEGATKFMQTLVSPEFLVPKKVGETVVTGNQFIPCVTAIAEIFNENQLPLIPSFFEALAQSQHLIAQDEGMASFSRSMSEFLSAHPDGISPNLFDDHVNNARQKSLELFSNKNLIGSQEMKERSNGELLSKIINCLEIFKTANAANFTARVDRDNAITALSKVDRAHAAEVEFRREKLVQLAVVHRDEALETLAAAKNKLASVHANVQNYHWQKEVQVKHRTRILGIVIGPTYTTQTVSGFNQEHFNRDVKAAQDEISRAEERLAIAEESVRVAMAS